MKFGTLLIHNVNGTDKHTGALSVPIYQTSTFHQADIDNPTMYNYSRSGNPTRSVLEQAIAQLEGGTHGFAFSSGMAATSSALSIFKSGDHVLVCEDVYGGTHRICNGYFKRFALETSFIDAADPGKVKSKIKKNTKAIFLETPSNPLLKITDLREMVRIAKENDLVVLVDNTFMSPYLQRPLELGADVVIHSATKFIGGHSDVVGGLVVVKDENLAGRIYSVQNSFGAILGPQDSWLLLRGLKTLKVRMDFQQKSAQRLAEWFAGHKGISHTFYPGLEGHPGRDVHFAQADGAGAVFSFQTRRVDTARRLMKKLKLAAVAVSLGGVETIVSYPVKMSHASMPVKERERLGILNTLIRVSVGLEETEDLIADFDAALRP